ncbi:MAG: succinate dehydrogenase cytochrome b subunit [Chitinophagaceae bacterium]|nr:succinate dehydrogenase cytochrome b subunit [Chitinophagaceae bacterium]
MKWKDLFTSSVGKKWVMALTGVFLILFLIVHAGINACIWANDGGVMFNKVAHFMGSTIVIRILEVGLFLGFLIHIFQGLILEFQNRKKRKTGYAVKISIKESTWYSRSMGLLGTLILLFLILHWKHFWVPSRFTGIPYPEVILESGKKIHNLYALMQSTFSELWVVIVYVLGCISLFWHLLHGFQSAFRTLGVSHPGYLKIIQRIGFIYSFIICLAFAMMPVSMYLGWVK